MAKIAGTGRRDVSSSRDASKSSRRNTYKKQWPVSLPTRLHSVSSLGVSCKLAEPILHDIDSCHVSSLAATLTKMEGLK
jgi:hypothetical protein